MSVASVKRKSSERTGRDEHRTNLSLDLSVNTAEKEILLGRLCKFLADNDIKINKLNIPTSATPIDKVTRRMPIINEEQHTPSSSQSPTASGAAKKQKLFDKNKEVTILF